MARSFNYAKRDFAQLRDEQFKYIKRYYPEVVQNFQDGSILSLLVDLNAGISDQLHYHIDRNMQENVLDFAQQRGSLFNIAKTYGLKLPTRSASVAVGEFSVEVPVFGDNEDERYLPILKSGSQFKGDGFSFELLNDVDFSSPTNAEGVIDRIKSPNFSGNKIASYTITKQGVLVNGVTKVFKEVISEDNVEPFYQIFLPEQNVLSIENVISKDGVEFINTPSLQEFQNPDLAWYEVPSLAEDKVFIVDPDKPKNSGNIKAGRYKKTNNRFIREFTPEGFCVLTFGSKTDESTDILEDYVQNGVIDLRSFIDNISLGVAPEAETTVFVRYRIGGGSGANVSVNTITEVGDINIESDGPDQEIVNNVEGSLTVTNITPGVGGADQPTLDELRNYIAYNFSSQQRGVTLDDYRALIMSMPSKFGTPARHSVSEEQNKIKIRLLTYDQNGNMDNIVSSTLMNNLANYLSKFRMINDMIEVGPGEVVDVGAIIDVLIDPENQSEIVSSIIQNTQEVFSLEDRDMGEDIYLGKVNKSVNNVEGVFNIERIRYVNKIGGQYSQNEIAQPYSDPVNNIIDTSDGVLYAEDNQILQIRFPEKDIVINPKLAQPERT